MWINPLYQPEDPLAVAKMTVDRCPLAVIIAEQPLRIAHMPVLWREDGTGRPVLVSHMPTTDPISRSIADGAPLTVVFPGPSSYVTPSWYHGPGLPTYNYVPVHVRGQPVALAPEELRAHLFDLVEDHEARHSLAETTWEFDQPALDRFERLLPLVIGFTVPIVGLEVKAKLGQNRSEEDNATVAAGLARGESDQRLLAALMTENASSSGVCPHHS